MEAPSKLFIKQEQIKVEMIPGGELPNVGIQYIRKDALLEWLNEKVSLAGVLKKEAYQSVIEKLNSM